MNRKTSCAGQEVLVFIPFHGSTQQAIFPLSLRIMPPPPIFPLVVNHAAAPGFIGRFQSYFASRRKKIKSVEQLLHPC